MLNEPEADVLVLGAGMAGLAAARALAKRGRKVIVLEARNRVGGRIFSKPTPEGITVEHGAEFVHGKPPELWALLDECGAKPIERDGTILREQWGGGLTEDTTEDDSLSALSELKDLQESDSSFAEWLSRSDIRENERAAIIGYVEGFNAADANRISVKALGRQQKAEDAIEGDRMWHVRGGYAQIAEYLAERVKELVGEVRLDERVRSVRWKPGAVEIETQSGRVRASNCVVTLPLGVLQSADADARVSFSPEPAALAHAQRMAMGQVVRFTLLFRERWWEDSDAIGKGALKKLSFLFTPGRMPPVWWTRHPEPEAAATLTGWIGGPRAQALAGKDAEELGREACPALAEAFGVAEATVRESLLATYSHDWALDPFSRGAYSYIPADAIDAPAEMTIPEADTIFFAGEHTDTTGHWGTVHAALGSGLRAARQILGEP